MKTANFILEFDPKTRQTIFSLDKDGQPYSLDWFHLSSEVDNTVLVQVRGPDEVIDSMKLDETPGRWLEDIPEVKPIEETLIIEEDEKIVIEDLKEPILDPKVAIEKDVKIEQELTLKADPIVIKEWIITKLASDAILQAEKIEVLDLKAKAGIEASITSSIDKLDWEDSDRAIESIVKLYGQTIEGYKNSGLGK